jgi:hypothetical protein
LGSQLGGRRVPRYSLTTEVVRLGKASKVQHAVAPQGGGRIVCASRHPPRPLEAWRVRGEQAEKDPDTIRRDLKGIWNSVEEIRKDLGGIWRGLEAIWRNLGTIWGGLEVICRDLEVIWRDLEAIW